MVAQLRVLDAVHGQPDEVVTLTLSEPPVEATDWLVGLSVYVHDPNVAVTLLDDVIATVQVVPLVLSQPDQLVNVEAEEGVAVSVTLVPLL
jgi:hypothetical protein